MNSKQQEYVRKIQPLAAKAAASTGLAPELIAAWWTWETDYGRNNTSKANNHAGIGAMSSGKDYVHHGHAGYKSGDNFVRDYVRVLSFDNDFYGYNKVLQAARNNPKNYEQLTQLHNDSKWSVAPYNVNTISARAREIAQLYGTSSPAPEKKTEPCKCPACGASLELSPQQS